VTFVWRRLLALTQKKRLHFSPRRHGPGPSAFSADRRHEIDNERIDFAKVFSPSFLRFQLPIPNDDCQVPELAEHVARDFFDWSQGPERREADEQIILKAGQISFCGGPQIAVQRMQLRFQNRQGRYFDVFSSGLFIFGFGFHTEALVDLRNQFRQVRGIWN